jgi:predicted secreted protein
MSGEDKVTVDLLETPSVHVTPGGSIDVEVPAKGATGHVWTVKADPAEVRIISHHQRPSTTSFGGGGTEVFTVQPVKQGNSRIVFQLGAPWKKMPAEEHELFVECKLDE